MTATKYVGSNTRDSSDWQPNVFLSDTIPASLKVTDSQISPNGNIAITYKRDGGVKTGAPQIDED